MVDSPGVLFISPVRPRAGGDGRAMRAYAWVHDLAQRHTVHVIVVRRPSEAKTGAEPESSNELPAASLKVLDAPGGATDLMWRAAGWIAPFLVLLQPRGFYYWNSSTPQLQQACQSWFLAHATLQAYDRVVLAAQIDADQLKARMPSLKTAVFANQLSAKPESPDLPPAPPFRLPFVGSLNYPPDQDAAEFLIEEVVPLLRQSMTGHWQITPVGRNPSKQLTAECRRVREVNLMADAPSVVPFYREAHVVLVPLRAGGGTKIKTLEAFLSGRPVVSTAEGVRGLAVAPNEHYVPAQNAAQFAQACAALARAGSRASRIAAAGQTVLLHSYHVARERQR